MAYLYGYVTVQILFVVLRYLIGDDDYPEAIVDSLDLLQTIGAGALLGNIAGFLCWLIS